MNIQHTIFASVLTASLMALTLPVAAQEEHVTPPQLTWSFAGPFGKYDPAQLQRGFKIYREVCSTCHSANYLSFRNLADEGGPGFSEAQAAAVAAEYKIKDIDDQGNSIERAGRLADYFPAPFPNEQAARAANGGAAPPDMSTLAKARGFQRGFPWFVFDIFTQYQEQGPDYIAALLQGYEEAPKDMKLPPGASYNTMFPGHAIGMAKPLQDGQVTYDDGSPQTLKQYSQDIAAFLMWVAEPHLVERKRIGLQVMVFLLVFAGLLYLVKKKVWHEIEAPREIAHGQDPAKTSL